MRRPLALAAVVAVVGGGAGLAVAGGGGGSGRATATTVATGTATVERRTLVEREEVDGTLGYGEARPVANRGEGTITKLAERGAVVERNGVLYELDGRPVRLLYGDVPFYRRLAAGVADGADVRQLEQNLLDLGAAKGVLSKADERWTSATTAALKRWQKSVGAEQDGSLDDGEGVFSPGAVRVAQREVQPGAMARPGETVLQVTGTARQIDVDLDARKQRLARVGAKVEVELPDGATATGTVTEVGSVATAPSGSDGGGGGGDGDPTIDITVVLDDPAAGGGLDGAPVDVRLTRQSKEAVLAVPVNALLALAEGGYAVEEAGTARLVRVETGLFSEGWVEVAGDGLAEGMRVVVPR